METGNDELNRLEEKLARGLKFADMLGFKNQQQLQDNQVLLHSLLEVMISKGLVRLHEVEERKKEVSQYFAEKENKGATVQLVDTPDKYTQQETAAIDCENRIHLCKAACCKLWFPLSVQDLDEGIVKWDYYRPYSIAHDESGYCTHMDKEHGCKCSIYKNRPMVCRTYDCRADQRIWLNFEEKIVNPELEKEGWPNI